MRRSPPDWLVAFVPWLGDRQAQQAWREWFEDTYVVDFVTGVTAGKVLETIIVMVGPVLVGEPIVWSERGTLALYVAATFLCFLGSIFRYHLSQAASNAKEKADDVTDAVGEAASDVADAASEAVSGESDT